MPDDATPAPVLRAMTLNLWAQHGDWPARRGALREGLRRLRPDVLALQEAVVDDAYDQAIDLLGEGYQVAHQRVGRLLVVSHGPSWPWWSEVERELQALAVARRIQELVAEDPAHVVVGGDFNAEPTASSMRFWTGRQSLDGTSIAYRDCWESVHGDDAGWTFDPRNPLTRHDEPDLDRGRRIDYLLVSCHEHGPTLRVADCRLALDEPLGGTMASDHYGVVADLEVPPGP
jgi:endonuclease/exonuclease/phosphatase family metal-dependent hydrolase